MQNFSGRVRNGVYSKLQARSIYIYIRIRFDKRKLISTYTTSVDIKHYINEPINLLVPELFFLILAHPVYKMLIQQEPNTLEL